VDVRARSDQRITVLPHGFRFGSAARNFFRILSEVQIKAFDYISFSDQDDIWLPNKLRRAHEVLQATGSGGYSSDVLAFWPDGSRRLIRKSQPQRLFDFLFEAAGPGCTYVLTSRLASEILVVLRSNWVDLQKIQLHDWFIYAAARANGFNWHIDTIPGLLYRQHSNNVVGVNRGWVAFKHRAKSVLGGWATGQSLLIAKAVGMSAHPYIKRGIGGGRWGNLWLSLRANHCRRRLKDQLFFALCCVALACCRSTRS
jgi:rhamnosyltransferase